MLARVSAFFQQSEYGAFAGFFCSLAGFVTAYLLFSGTPKIVGIGAILFATLLALPLFNRLLVKYERVAAQTHLERVFHVYKPLINYLSLFFVGMFVVFFVLALVSPQFVFSREDMFGVEKLWARQKLGAGLPPPPVETRLFSEIARIFWHNARVMLISFVLSLFFGAGALFLIALNASIFAAGLAEVIYGTLPLQSTFALAYGFIACNLSVMLLHTIPESLGYLLAAIAGGILGHAVLAEKLGSRAFSFVKKDIFVILLGSFFILFVAAVIEITVSKPLFEGGICVWNKSVVLLAAGSMLVVLFVLEWLRRNHLHKI